MAAFNLKSRILGVTENRRSFRETQKLALRMATEKDWDMALLDPVRRQRLLHPPSAEHICKSLITEAARAAEQAEIALDWQEACDKPGYFRLRTQIPVTESTYDLLFNSRSGYRAQYFLSPEEGMLTIDKSSTV